MASGKIVLRLTPRISWSESCTNRCDVDRVAGAGVVMPSNYFIKLVWLCAGAFGMSACSPYMLHGSDGGGQTEFVAPRTVRAADIALPEGYRIEPVATNLTFPTDITVDDGGEVYVIEAGYAYGEVWTEPRLLRVEPDGRTTTIAAGGRNGPWTGVAVDKGAFYIAEGGTLEGGRILRVSQNGEITPLIENLPTLGDHHTNGPAIGPDGQLYFALGTATNSGIAGVDNFHYGWLARETKFHDIPCEDVTLAGQNFETDNPLTQDPEDRATTGAYAPFGTITEPGQVIPGRVPCSGAILRVTPDGGEPELVAWGLRNPFGLAFSPQGKLYVTENAFDVRGSRPAWGTPEVLWAIAPGAWYGWPDFSAGQPLTMARYAPPGGDPLKFLLAEHPGAPPEPAAVLGVHALATGLDFSHDAGFGYEGQAFIAEFGDMAPTVGKIWSPVGFKIVRVDLKTGVVHDFAVNQGELNGAASKLGSGGLERPIAMQFDPAGEALYVLDFGVMTLTDEGPVPRAETGVLWRITREDQP
jgi:glucose/arabinose dehydrogenase